VAAVKGIYDHYGWTFTNAAAEGILRWVRENPADKHGKRTYSLEEFGLTEDDIRAVYGDYIEEYHEYL